MKKEQKVPFVAVSAALFVLASAGFFSRVFAQEESRAAQAYRAERLRTKPVQAAPSPSPTSEPMPIPVAPPATPEPAPTPFVNTADGRTHILMYHYVRSGVDPAKDKVGFGLSVTPSQFEEQLAALRLAGYGSLTMADFAAGKGGAKDVVLTFDDGYEDFYTEAWPLLKKYGFTATAYVISGKIGGQYLTWDQIRELSAAGIEIGAHTVNHIDLAKASEAKQREEIFGSKAAIEAELGRPVLSFCYPAGRHSAVTDALAKEAGYTTATTTAPGSAGHSDDPYTLKRVRISPQLTGPDLLGLIR